MGVGQRCVCERSGVTSMHGSEKFGGGKEKGQMSREGQHPQLDWSILNKLKKYLGNRP